MIYRWPGFLAVVRFSLSPTPPPLSRHQVVSVFSVFLCVAGRAYWRERGGGGPESYNDEKAWSSINHSILSLINTPLVQGSRAGRGIWKRDRSLRAHSLLRGERQDHDGAAAQEGRDLRPCGRQRRDHQEEARHLPQALRACHRCLRRQVFPGLQIRHLFFPFYNSRKQHETGTIWCNHAKRLLRSPRIDCKESIQPACAAWPAGTDNPLPIQFLAPIDCLQILGQGGVFRLAAPLHRCEL